MKNMKLKRVFAFFIAAALIVGVFSGCADKSEIPGTTDPSETESDTQPGTTDNSSEEERKIKYAEVYNMMKPDTVICTIGGKPVCWQEYFYWLLVSIEYFIEEHGDISDWKATDGTNTVEEYILGEAINVLKLYRAVEKKAEELGVTLSESDLKYLKTNKDNVIEEYGGREKFEEALANNFMTEEMYDKSNEISVLYYNTFVEMYGPGGEGLDDEDVYAFAESINYMRIKQIMLNKTGDDGLSLESSALAEKLSLAESLLKQIKDAPESERAELFDSLEASYNEDIDKETFPDGYSFAVGNGDIMEEIETAASELEIGQVSDVIESEHGFHIIIRVPVLADEYVDEYYTLRYYAAYSEFEKLAVGWQKNIPTEYHEAYDNVVLSEMFPEL